MGCGLSLWSVLLLLGVTWRNHVRPSATPLLILAAIVGFGARWPRFTGAIVILIALWAFSVIRKATTEADHQIRELLTRTAILRHVEPATHLVHVWFSRILRSADITLLLAVAHRARDIITVLPRLRSVANATGSLSLLTRLADHALDTELRTDHAATRATSWIRVLTGRLLRSMIRRTGVAATAQLMSAVLLAVPPARQQGWGESNLEESSRTTPDTDEYLKTVLTALPKRADEASLAHVREQLRRDGSRAGAQWFTTVTKRAEQWRERVPPSERDWQIELLAEMLWGVYEDNIGPRPVQYDLYDQLRLQFPEAVEGLTLENAEFDEKDQTLALVLRGFPKAVHEVTFSVGRKHTGSEIVLDSRDGRSWMFERLEAGEERGVVVVFHAIKA